MTDVSVKRKVRDYVHRELGIDIFIQSEFALNSLIFKAAKKFPEIPIPRTPEITDEDLLMWLRNNIGKIDGLEELGLEGNEAFWGGEFNKKTFSKILKDYYKQQTDGLQKKLDDAARTLKATGKYDTDDELLLETLESHKNLSVTEGCITLKEGIDQNNFDEKTIIDIPRSMLVKLQIFVNDLSMKATKKLEKEDREKVRQEMIDNFFDIRMFGAVLSTGINAGQVRGPMQIKFGRSIDRVVPIDHSITRCAITRSEDLLRKETEMARKPNIPYGLYRVHGYYNPSLARRKKPVAGKKDQWTWKGYVSGNDLAVFWEALENMYEKHSASSAAAGEQATRCLWVFSHDTAKGNAHAHQLFELIDVKPCGEGNEPRKFEDYANRMEYPGKETDTNISQPRSLTDRGFPGVWITRLV